MKVERTKKGFPALWEEGGGATNTGDAQLVAGRFFEPLTPIYIRRSGSLSNARHALFVVDIGYHVVNASHHRRDFVITVSQIASFDGDEATLKPIAVFSNGEWDTAGELLLSSSEELRKLVEVAKEKATCYHCREPHYFA